MATVIAIFLALTTINTFNGSSTVPNSSTCDCQTEQQITGDDYVGNITGDDYVGN